MAKYKSARAKLEASNHASLVEMPAVLRNRYPVGRLYIPTGIDVDGMLREISPGQIRTSTEVRDDLGQRNGAATTCAMVFGILWRVAAEAAEEDSAEGQREPAPYWRVIRDDGSLNEKLPGGVERQAALLRNEGHTVAPAGRAGTLRVQLK